MKKLLFIIGLCIVTHAVYPTKLVVDNINSFQLENVLLKDMTCVVYEKEKSVTCTSTTPGIIQQIQNIKILPHLPRDRSRIIGNYSKQNGRRSIKNYVVARTQIR